MRDNVGIGPFVLYCRNVILTFPNVLPELAPFVDNPVRFVQLCAQYYLNAQDEGHETGSEPPSSDDENGFSDTEMEPQGLIDGEGQISANFCLDCESWPCVCFLHNAGQETREFSATVQNILRVTNLVNSLQVFDLDEPMDTDDSEPMEWDPYCEVVMESQGNNTSKGQAQNQSNANQGTVINNYYHNTYQGSIDMSGVAAGGKPQSTFGGLVDGIGSAFASMAPLLADQNTEEMTDLADRVMTETAGNSAINTQSTVGRMVGYGRVSDDSQPTSCGDLATKGQPATDRWFTYRMMEWTTTQTHYEWQMLKLPTALMDAASGGVFSQNAARHYALKCGWKVQVQCNASHFHAGALLCFMAPEWPSLKNEKTWQSKEIRRYGITETHDADNIFNRIPDLGFTTPEQWPVFPHQVLNVRTGTSVDIEVPYIGVTPTSDPTVHQPWTLVIAVLTPLTYAAGASPNIDITVSVQPVNPVWNGLRQPIESQGLPTQPRENIGQFTTTLPDYTTPFYGLVKNRPTDYLPGEFTDLVQVARIPCFLSIVNGSERYPFFSVGNTVEETPVFSTSVVLSATSLINTMVGNMGNFFAQYRGSLNFNFLFTGTAMMKLKLLIAYTPPGAGRPTTLDQAMQGTYCIWDIGLNSSWVFTVPFISVSDWRFTQQGSANTLNADGWLTVWQLTPLTFPPGNPPNAYIVVYGAAGADFSFRNPIFTQWLEPQGTDNAEKGEVSTDTAVQDYEGQALDEDHRHTSVSFFYDRSRVLGFLMNYRYEGLTVNSPEIFDTQGRLSGAEAGARAYLRTGHLRGMRVMRLCPHPSLGIYQIPFFMGAANFDRVFWNLAPFTYFRADLEVTVLPYSPHAEVDGLDRWAVYWYPCGAPLPNREFNNIQWKQTHNNADVSIGPPFSNIMPGMVNVDPQAVGYGKNAVSFQIPWNSPQTVCSTTFSGYSSYSKLQGYYGTGPANYWGWLQVVANRPSNDVIFLVYVRYKNMRTWVPRPVTSRPVPFNTGRVRMAQLDLPRPRDLEDAVLESQGLCSPFKGKLIKGLPLKLRTTSEPIVTFHRDGPMIGAWVTTGKETAYIPWLHAGHVLFDCKYVARNFHDWVNFQLAETPILHSQGGGLSKSAETENEEEDEVAVLATVCAALEAETSVETIAEGWSAIKALKKRWAETKNLIRSTSFWTKAVSAIIKLVILTYAWIESEKTSVKVAISLYAMLAGLEWSGLLEMFVEFLKRVFTTEPPPMPVFDVKTLSYKPKEVDSQGPMQILQYANQSINLARGADWIVHRIKDLVDWIKAWFDKEEATPKHRLAQMVEELPQLVSEIHKFREGKIPQVSTETQKKIAETYELAISLGNTALANFLERFRTVWTHTQARTEPVVVILKGKPGRGKSVAAQVIAQAVSKVVTGHQSVYSFPPDSKYFDGYTGQFAMIMDDLGQNPDGEDFKVFCQMVSTTHFVPNMAALDQKGVSFQTQLIIATTNQAQFRPVTVADPEAIQRRITFEYTVEPDSFIATPDGKLNLEKALEKTGEFEGECSFNFDCPLLRYLKFRSGQERDTLPSVIDDIVETLVYKRNQASRLNTLVSQGLALKVEDPLLEQTLANLNKYIGELQDHRQQVLEARRDFDLFCKVILGFAATIAAGYGIKKLLQKEKTPQAQMIVTPKAVVVDNGAQGAYDGKTVKKPRKDLQILNLEGGNPQLDFEVYCAQKVVYQIQFRNGTELTSQSVLAVKERVFIVNAHSMKADWDSFTLVRPEGSLSFKRDEGYEVIEIHKKGASTDLAFVRLKAGPFFKDNVSKFAEGLPKKNLEVTGVAHFCDVPLLYEGTVITDVTSMNTTTGLYNNCFRYMAKTRKGYCGSAVVGLEGNAKRIFGMHAAGAEGVAGACCLQRSMIEKVLKQLGVDTKLHSQGLLIEEERGPYVHVCRRTQLRPTVAKEYFNPHFGPAALSKNDKRLLPGVNLDETIFSKHKGNTLAIPRDMVDMAREYANQLFSQVGRDNGKLTVREAILGIDGLDPMEKKTSPGLPYTLMSKRREDLLDFESGEIRDPKLMSEVNSFLNGDYSDHIFQTFLKDEIRPLEKVQVGKTRIVDVASLGHCITGRSLLGRFASKFQTRPGFEIGSAIGCNPDVDWTRFYHDMMKHKYVYDVDYSNFDASHGTAIFEVLKQEIFNTANGFDPAVGAYLDSLAVSRHAYEDRRFLIVGGLPSGCSSTSVLNTVMNNIIIRTGLAMTYKNFDFYDVKVLAYGDDLLLATDYELDLNLLQARMEKIGYKITPANKEGAFRSTMEVQDVQFLKRKFVNDSGRPFLVRPVMDSENLAAMLSFYRPGTMTERLESIVQLAVHSGREVYDWLFKPYRDAGYLIPEWTTANRRWYQQFE